VSSVRGLAPIAVKEDLVVTFQFLTARTCSRLRLDAAWSAVLLDQVVPWRWPHADRLALSEVEGSVRAAQADQAENEVPQPHDLVAWGFTKTKPCCISVS